MLKTNINKKENFVGKFAITFRLIQRSIVKKKIQVKMSNIVFTFKTSL